MANLDQFSLIIKCAKCILYAYAIFQIHICILGERRLEICRHGDGSTISLDIHCCGFSRICGDHTTSARSLRYESGDRCRIVGNRGCNRETSLRTKKRRENIHLNQIKSNTSDGETTRNFWWLLSSLNVMIF